MCPANRSAARSLMISPGRAQVPRGSSALPSHHPCCRGRATLSNDPAPGAVQVRVRASAGNAKRLHDAFANQPHANERSGDEGEDERGSHRCRYAAETVPAQLCALDIVERACMRIAKRLISEVDRLEALFRGLVATVKIRMPTLGHFAVGALDSCGIRPARDPKDPIQRHSACPPQLSTMSMRQARAERRPASRAPATRRHGPAPAPVCRTTWTGHRASLTYLFVENSTGCGTKFKRRQLSLGAMKVVELRLMRRANLTPGWPRSRRLVRVL